MPNRILNDSRFHLSALFLLCLLLYFPFLGSRDFWENEYAEVTRVIFLEGNFVRPEVNGKPWINQSPLFFGLVVFCPSSPVRFTN